VRRDARRVLTRIEREARRGSEGKTLKERVDVECALVRFDREFAVSGD
jgi:hypothetical protein